jgi:hypothetical protein
MLAAVVVTALGFALLLWYYAAPTHRL